MQGNNAHKGSEVGWLLLSWTYVLQEKKERVRFIYLSLMTKHESQTAPIGSSKEILITHGKRANAVAQWVLGEFQNSGEV